jgi:uroporphyrinogen decarboxylase
LRIVEDANPSIDERIVNSRKDLQNIVIPDPEKDGRLPTYLEAIDLLKLKVEEKIPLLSYVPGPFTLSGVLYGVDSLMLDILRNPDFIHELNTFTTLASKRFAEAKINHGVDIVVVADPTSSTNLISPDMFEEFSLPYLKEVILSINEVEAIPSIHICGKTDLILEKMADTKAKIIEVDSMINLNEAKKRIGDKTCLMGNVDTSTLLSGNPSDVEKEVKNCIYQVGEDGGFILSSGCEVPLNTPIKNIKTMVHATKIHGVY